MLIKGITLYNPDIHHIPEYNWQKFQRCLLMGAGIGSTTQEAISKVDAIHTLIAEDRKEDIETELTNFKLLFYSSIEGLSYDSMAFACLVDNINGNKPDIRTDTDIKVLSEQIALTGITHGEIAEYLEDVKKKLILN